MRHAKLPEKKEGNERLADRTLRGRYDALCIDRKLVLESSRFYSGRDVVPFLFFFFKKKKEERIRADDTLLINVRLSLRMSFCTLVCHTSLEINEVPSVVLWVGPVCEFRRASLSSPEHISCWPSIIAVVSKTRGSY